MTEDPKRKKRVTISPELANVFNSSIVDTANRAYRMESARNRAMRPVNEPAPQVNPDFNVKPDRIDRESDFTQAVRAASYNPGSLADRYSGDTRAVDAYVESRITREGEYDPNLIDPSITDAVTPEAIAARNAQEDVTVDEAKQEAVDGVDPEANPFDFTVGGAADAAMQAELEWMEAEDDERQTVDTPPVTSLTGQTDRRDFMISRYPTLALGLAQGDFTEREMRDTINFSVAFDSAATLAQMPTEEMARAYLGKMSIAQQLLVLDISEAMRQEQYERSRTPYLQPRTDAEKAAAIDEASSAAYQQFSFENQAEAGQIPFELGPAGYVAETLADRVARVGIINEEDQGNTVTTFAKHWWNWTGGLAFEVLFNDVNEALQLGYRTVSLGADKLGGNQYNAAFGSNLGYAGYDTSWSDVWAMAQTGAVDQNMVDQISQKYGAEKTSIALQLMEAQHSSDLSVLPQIILELSQRELAGDAGAGELLQWIGDTQYAGGERYAEAMQVMDELQLARTGNTGNLFAIGVMGQPPEAERLNVGQSTTYNALSTTGQVFGYMLDPFWFTSPARTGVMASRYGMWRLLSAESRGLKRADEFTAVFSQAPVRRALTTLGQDLRAIDDAPDLGVAGQTRKSVEARWKRFFNPAALDDMRGYMKALPEDEAYTPQAFQDFFENNENLVEIVTGAHATRGRQLTVPHMTVATATIKKAMMAARGMTYEKGSGAAYIDELIGKGWTKSMPADAAEALASALAKAETEDDIARVLGDFVWREDGTEMVRSFTGRVAGMTGIGRGIYGWRTKGTPLVSRRWWQRKRRLGQRMPMDGGPIKTIDGSEAGRVGDLLEWAGMPRYFSRAVEEVWANPATTNAQRTAMLPGLVRSAVRAKGIDQVDESGEIMQRIAGYTRGDIYSPAVPNMTEIAPAIREQVRAQNTRLLEEERTQRFGMLGREVNDYRAGDEVFFWDGDKWQQTTVANVTSRGGVRIKGQGNKTVNKDLLVPKSGSVAVAQEPAVVIADTPRLPTTDEINPQHLDLVTRFENYGGGASLPDRTKSVLNEWDSPGSTDPHPLSDFMGEVPRSELDEATKTLAADFYARTQEGLVARGLPETVTVVRTGSPTTNRGIVSVTLRDGPVENLSGDVTVYTVPRERILFDNEYIRGQRNPSEQAVGRGTLATQEQEALVRFSDLTSMADDVAPARREVVEPTVTVRISRNYLADAIGRDLIDIDMPGGAGNTAAASLNRAQVQELLDDVRFYLDENGPLSDDTFGDAASRRAQIKSLRGVENKLVKALEDIGEQERLNLEEVTRRLEAENVAPVDNQVAQAFREFARPDIDLKTNRASRKIIRKARQNEPRKSASEYAPGQHGAVVLADATERMAFPSITALDRYSRRASVLTALLGNNKWMQGLTDIWTLGTLAGPRFQVRSGIEDIGLYMLTGGELGAIATGRSMAQAIRKSTMRTKNTGIVYNRRAKRVGTDEDGNAIYAPVEPDRPQKLGIVATGWRNAVNGLTDGVLKSMARALFNKDYSPALDTLNHVLVAQATKAELRMAAEAAAEGNRRTLALLVGKVYLRQRLAGHPVFGWMAKVGGRDTAELTARQQQDLAYLSDAVEFDDTLRAMEDVSELSSHLFDGAPISTGGAVPVGEVFFDSDSGRWMRRIFKDDNWQTVPMNSSDLRTVDWWNSLAKAMPIADGPKAYASLSRLVRYVKAIQQGDSLAKNDIISEVAEVIGRHWDDDVWGYGRRLVIADQTGARGLAEATLENLRVLFTGRNGDMNWDLYNKVRVQGDEFAEFSIRNIDEDGTVTYNVSVDDLRNMADHQKPLGVISNLGQTKEISAQQTWVQFGWGGMGRSLARMTREPIFMGQYIEARRLLQPLEDARRTRLIDEGFEEDVAGMKAREWATKAATERAYNTTMDYVDNPAIRSQLAWEVRNVARFYRALEDFGRRMIRTARNEPSAFLKLGAAWRVLDSSGFFWEDEYGEQYFIWPGTPQMFSGVNWFLNNVADRGNMYTPDLPLAFTSNVTMLTPSADPNALFPTFSGFYSAATVLPIVKGFKSLFGVDLEQELFGEYSKNTQWPLGALPPHLVRVAQSWNVLSGDITETSVNNRLNQNRGALGLNSLYVSSAFSTIQAAGAAGWWNENEYMTPEEKTALMRRVDRAAVWVTGLKIALSPVLPAAIQAQDLSSSDMARSLGYNDLRSEFIQLLKEAENPDDAVVAWMQMYPDGRSPFIAVEGRGGEQLTSGYWTPFKETADFVEKNADLVEENPLGLSFFQPGKGETTLRAFEVLKVNDLTPEGTPLNYLERVLTSHADAVEEQEKRLYQMDRLADAVPQKVWSQTRLDLQERFPNMGGGEVSIPSDTNFEYGSEDYESTPVARMRQAGEELRDRGQLDKRGEYLMELIAVSEEIYRNLYPRDFLDPQREKYRTAQGEYWDAVIRKAAEDNPNDRIFMSALRELTLHLDFGWPAEVEVANG